MRSLHLLAALLCVGLASPVLADDAGASAPTPAAQSFKLGALTLIALHDSEFTAPNDAKIFGVDAGAPAVAAVLKAAGLPEDRIAMRVGALVVHSGHHVVLLDTGKGPGAHGTLLASLQAAGITPSQITDVLITHSHGDHVGGLVGADGQAAFPRATVHLSAAEWSWMRSKPEAADLVKAIGGHVRTFTPGAIVVPGITSVALDGHTPGHVGYEITSRNQSLLDIGDLVHHPVISLQKPEWAMGFDSDRALGKATRRATLARLATAHEWVFAPHLPFPGVGHVATEGEGFKWVPGTP